MSAIADDARRAALTPVLDNLARFHRGHESCARPGSAADYGHSLRRAAVGRAAPAT